MRFMRSVRLSCAMKQSTHGGFEVERRTEVSLDYLMSERYFEPSAMDSYFEKQDKADVFLVVGKGSYR